MNRTTITKLGTSALVSLGLIAGAATMASAESHTANKDMAEAQAFLAAPGSIAAAISAAEAQSGGKAIDAGFEHDGAEAGMYSVEVVMADGTTVELLVNPADNSVKAAPAETDENENDEGDEADDTNETGEAAETTGN